jgi:hypothetical protein
MRAGPSATTLVEMPKEPKCRRNPGESEIVGERAPIRRGRRRPPGTFAGGRCLPGKASAGVLQNVHASTPAVDQVEAAVLVHADVVRVDRLFWRRAA